MVTYVVTKNNSLVALYKYRAKHFAVLAAIDVVFVKKNASIPCSKVTAATRFTLGV